MTPNHWVGGILALCFVGCTSYGGTQVTSEMLSSMPVTKLLTAGDGATRVSPGIVWYIWNELNDPTSKLSVESKIRRAALNASGYTCENYNARGDHLTKGWFYELGSMATGAQTTPNGGCVSGERPPPEVYAEIRTLGGADVSTVAAIAKPMGFSCSPVADGALLCSAEFVERETVKQPREFVAKGEKDVTQTDYRHVVVLTYSPGHAASIALTRTSVPKK